ncbi:DUF2285 domain-containing protein [Variovorax sp. LT2P21]|uniref:DUF2285 domain-containing protein n=1 Tax=Variovorax sp. LT2P21 TaxID=3443731 RepID=UPI003F45BB6A
MPRGRGDDPHGSSDGACDVAEDPRLDAREAHPHWLASADELLQVRASRSHRDASRFDLWRIPGRKRLTLGDAELTLTAAQSALNLRVALAGDVADGAGYTCAVPLTPALRGQLDVFGCQAKALQGETPAGHPVRPVTRAALLHLRAVQALDAAQAGASHRDIAQALFGLEAVVLRWHEDGELRAQVRHLLRRAEGYMTGDYRDLAGVSPAASKHPGDEALR